MFGTTTAVAAALADDSGDDAVGDEVAGWLAPQPAKSSVMVIRPKTFFKEIPPV